MAVAATADFSIIIMDATTLRASCSDRWLLWLDLTMMFRSCILLRKHTAFLSRLSPSALIDYYLQQDLPTIVVVSSHFHNNFLAVRSPIHPNQETWHFNWWNDVCYRCCCCYSPAQDCIAGCYCCHATSSHLATFRFLLHWQLGSFQRELNRLENHIPTITLLLATTIIHKEEYTCFCLPDQTIGFCYHVMLLMLLLR